MARIVLDSSAVTAFLKGTQPAAGRIKAALDAGRPLLPWVVLFELELYALQHGVNFTESRSFLLGRTELVLPTPAFALQAAKTRHSTGLAAADAIIYATARENACDVWTRDSDFKKLPGVKFI